MDDLVSRKKVLDTIYEWVMQGESEKEDGLQLLGERIRSIPPEEVQPYTLDLYGGLFILKKY